MKTQIITTAIRSRAIILGIILIIGTTTFAQRRENTPATNKEQPREYRQEQKSSKVDKNTKAHQTPKKEAYERRGEYKHQPNNKDKYNRNDDRYDKSAKHYDRDKGHKPNHNYDGPTYKKHNDGPTYKHHKDPKYRPAPYRYDYHVRHNNHYIRRLPHGTHWIHYNNTKYYIIDGLFYVHTPYGFRIADPPRYLHRLPAGCSKVWIDGSIYFTYHGIFFEHTPYGFRILI